jgi:hypothetical protein
VKQNGEDENTYGAESSQSDPRGFDFTFPLIERLLPANWGQPHAPKSRISSFTTF